MKATKFFSALMVGFLAFGGTSLQAQELYYGDDDDMSPEEYYLEGIGYGDSDYGSGGVEDQTYSGLYSASSPEAPVYGGNSYTTEGATSSVDTGGYALPVNPGLGGTGMDAGDWFSMSGVSILEAIGDDASGRILITRDQSGEIDLLQVGEEKQGAFKVMAIGSEQARVEPATGGPAKVVPILHRSAPIDSFLAAAARLQGLRLVIGAPVKREVSYDASMLDIETGFAPSLAQSNLFIKRFDDVVVVRNAAFLDGATTYQPSDRPEGDSVDLSFFRGSGDEILDKVASALPHGTGQTPESLPQGTTALLGSTPAAEALHYLNLAWTTQIEVALPKTVAKASKSKLSKEKMDKLYRQSVKLARAGKYKAAGKRLRYLCKNGSRNPAHFQALGKVYWKLGRIVPAARAWKAGYKLDPSNATSRKLLVKAKAKIKQARRRSRS